MTKREMAAQLLALRAERDELKEALIDAVSVFVQLGAGSPHVEGGDCLHCAALERAAEFGRPLRRYAAEFEAERAVFARDNPERYAELRRGVFGVRA
jgi:hypothetical protein